MIYHQKRGKKKRIFKKKTNGINTDVVGIDICGTWGNIFIYECEFFYHNPKAMTAITLV